MKEVMILQMDTQKCVVSNPKKMDYWKTLIDRGALVRCQYRMKIVGGV